MHTKRIFILLPLVFLFSIASSVKAQLDDIATAIPESIRPKVSTVDGRYQVEITLSEYREYGEIEGVMIQLAAETQPEISFRFRQSGGQFHPISYRVRVVSGEAEIVKAGVFYESPGNLPGGRYLCVPETVFSI
jgi:hypothetical protein